MKLQAAFMVPHPPLIVKEVGKGSEKEVIKTIKSYEAIAEEIKEIEPDTIIITSPHSIIYNDYFHISSSKKEGEGDFSNFNAKEICFEENFDYDLIEKINQIAEKEQFPAGILGETDRNLDHGCMVPLYFIRKKYQNYKLVVIGLSNLPLSQHYHLGMIIQKAIEQSNKKVVIIASGDLSHKLQSYGPYGYADEGPIYDQKIMEIMGKGEFQELLEFKEDFLEKAAECGHRSFTIMAGALDELEADIKEYSHEDITGVGYGICSYHRLRKNKNRDFLTKYLEKEKNNIYNQIKNEDSYISLARKTIENYINNNQALTLPNKLEKDMYNKKAGVFVSIHKMNNLRGCMGTFLPTTNCIGEEIISNAILAATKDPRFNPIKKEELPYLEIKVDILNTPEYIESINELDPKKYGVIVSNKEKRGLLLPNLDGIDTVEEQLDIARKKANIADNDPVEIQRFCVERHE